MFPRGVHRSPQRAREGRSSVRRRACTPFAEAGRGRLGRQPALLAPPFDLRPIAPRGRSAAGRAACDARRTGGRHRQGSGGAPQSARRGGAGGRPPRGSGRHDSQSRFPRPHARGVIARDRTTRNARAAHDSAATRRIRGAGGRASERRTRSDRTATTSQSCIGDRRAGRAGRRSSRSLRPPDAGSARAGAARGVSGPHACGNNDSAIHPAVEGGGAAGSTGSRCVGTNQAGSG